MTDSNVVKIRPAEDPDEVLEAAKGKYESVFILGYSREDGELDVRSSLDLDHKDLIWMVSLFQSKLLNGDYVE